jgi:hypothetical protein
MPKEKSKKPKGYVFVNWDPLYERVVCVHKKENSTCKKCEKILNENRGAYHLVVNKFLIKD